MQELEDENTPRILDSELRTQCKAMSPDFDPLKLSFVLEAEGHVQEEQIAKAQSLSRNALRSSLQAAFDLFCRNVEADSVAHRAWVVASSNDEARARAAVVQSLEEWV